MDHSFAAAYLMRARTSMSAPLPSGKLSTTRVRRPISRLSRSIMLFVRMRLRRPSGNPGSRQVVVPPIPSRRQLAAAFSLLASISAATVPALSNADSRDSMANTALRAADAHSRWAGGVLESTSRKKCTMHRRHPAFGGIESTVATSPAHRSPTTSRTPLGPRSIRLLG